MNTKIKLLAALLCVQILLALGLGFSHRQSNIPTPQSLVQGIVRDTIDTITLEGPDREGPDREKIVLARKNGAWVLGQGHDFPADTRGVNTLLDRLLALQTGTPVATTPEARERFKVDETSFERRITLETRDADPVVVYLGTSPGLRQVHARVDNDDAIYVVKMASYDVPLDSSSWEDKTLLQFPREKITGVRLGDVYVKKQPDTTSGEPSGLNATNASQETRWHLAEDRDGQEVNGTCVDQLITWLDSVRFDEVWDPSAREKNALQQPVVQFEIQGEQGEHREYRLFHLPQQKTYVMTSSSRPEYFRLATHTAEEIMKTCKPETWIVDTASSPASADSPPQKQAEEKSTGD
jgi:hypothetical protein